MKLAYAEAFHDPFMGSSSPPTWFKSFLAMELGLQLPVFVYIIYAMLGGAFSIYDMLFTFNQGRVKWLKEIGLLYTGHVVTTMVPVMVSLLSQSSSCCQGQVYS